jgi:hypothetical protein
MSVVHSLSDEFFFDSTLLFDLDMEFMSLASVNLPNGASSSQNMTIRAHFVTVLVHFRSNVS